MFQKGSEDDSNGRDRNATAEHNKTVRIRVYIGVRLSTTK